MDSTAPAGRLSDRPPAKRHLRNLLLDKKFQLRWVLKVAAATSVVVAAMGVFLYRTVVEATDLILTEKLGDPSLTEEAVNAFVAQAEADKVVTMLTLVTGLAFLVLLLAGLTIIWTHKIAGPAYKLRQIFKSIDGDHLQLRAKLRKADELQQTFVEFDDMLRRLREDRRRDIDALESLKEAIEGCEGCGSAVQRVDELLIRFKSSVRMD